MLDPGTSLLYRCIDKPGLRLLFVKVFGIFLFLRTYVCVHPHYTPTDLYISVEADSRHKDPVQALEGSRSVLLLVDIEGQCVLGQIQKDAYGRALDDTSLRPTHTPQHVNPWCNYIQTLS